MYRHIAEQILETPERQFVSQAEKDNWNSKSDKNHTHDNQYYTKTEIDKELNVSYIEKGGVMVNIKGTRKGMIKNLEVPGTTYQSDNPSYITFTGDKKSDGTYELPIATRNRNIFTTELVHGMIQSTDGKLTGSDSYVSSKDFIRVDVNKTYVFRNKQNIKVDTVFQYNTEKILNKVHTVTDNKVTITNSGFIKFRYKIEGVGAIADINSVISEIEIYDEVDGYPGYYTKPEYCEQLIKLPYYIGNVGPYTDKLYIKDNKLILEKHTEFVKMERYRVLATAADLGSVYRIGYYFDVECPDVIKENNKFGNEKCTLFSKCISNWELDEPHFYMANVASTVNRTSIFFYIDKTKITGPCTNDNITKYLKQQEVRVLVARETPRYIEIEDVDKFRLPTYDGKTELFIPARDKTCIIKGHFPVNIGSELDSTMEKLSVNEIKLQNIENLVDGQKLEFDLQNTRTVTISESSDGYLSDIEIKGNTLVSVQPPFKFDKNDFMYTDDTGSTIEIDNNGYAICTHAGNNTWFKCFWHRDLTKYKPGTYYTVITDIRTNTLDTVFDICLNVHTDSIFESNVTIEPGRTGVFVHYVRTRNEFGRAMIGLRNQASMNTTAGKQIKFKQAVFEGKIPKDQIGNVFHGMESVGETNNGLKIRTQSVDNLIDLDSVINTSVTKAVVYPNTPNRFYLEYTKDVTSTAPMNQYSKVWFRALLKANTRYTLEYLMDGDKDFSKQFIDIKYLGAHEHDTGSIYIVGDTSRELGQKRVFEFTTGQVSGMYQINFYISNSTEVTKRYLAYYEDIMLYEGNRRHPYLSSEYKPARWYEKQLVDSSGNNIVLHKLPNGVCDRIYKSGKHYLLEKCVGTKILTGDENWVHEPNALNQNSTMLFRIVTPPSDLEKPIDNYRDDMWLSDRFASKFAGVSGVWGTDSEGTSVNSHGVLDIRILKSRLETPDLEGFKKWIAANNVKFIYEKKVPTTEIIPDIEIETFNGGTKLDILGGNAQPSRLNFKTTSDVASVVNTLIDKIQQLENKIPLVKRLSLIAALDNIDTEYKLNNLINSSNTK